MNTLQLYGCMSDAGGNTSAPFASRVGWAVVAFDRHDAVRGCWYGRLSTREPYLERVLTILDHILKNSFYVSRPPDLCVTGFGSVLTEAMLSLAYNYGVEFQLTPLPEVLPAAHVAGYSWCRKTARQLRLLPVKLKAVVPFPPPRVTVETDEEDSTKTVVCFGQERHVLTDVVAARQLAVRLAVCHGSTVDDYTDASEDERDYTVTAPDLLIGELS